MEYIVSLRSTKSGQVRNFKYWLNFALTDTLKIKNFVLAFNGLLEGKAKVTEIKAIIFEDTDFQLSDFDVVLTSKIMYDINGGAMINCTIPYLDPQKSRTVIEGFMAQYFENFKKINNIMQKKEV